MLNFIAVVVTLAAALVLAIGLAFLPMRLLLSHIAANIQTFIARQRERRRNPADAGTSQGERERGPSLIFGANIS